MAPEAIHHHVKTFRENMKNMHYIAPESKSAFFRTIIKLYMVLFNNFETLAHHVVCIWPRDFFVKSLPDVKIILLAFQLLPL